MGSNCALKASTSINTLVLSQHEGGECLDDVVHIAKDRLCVLSPINKYQPHKPSALGLDSGKDNQGIKALRKANKTLLKATLNNCKNITLILIPVKSLPIKQMPSGPYKAIRAICQWWAYSPNRTNVATDFRAGNVSPNTDNLGFIKTCQDALPKDTNIKKLRIDAAGYQASIIDYALK
ncbi:hypothetical protein BSPWISOXPB_6393 [uncultured Gammaproteobacteria bacterium]|nr:hypothetical protein BSPWISOXPB_6393 [uncultured Gammaproteobacteria bacterium]